MGTSKRTTEEDRKGIMGTSKRTTEEDRKGIMAPAREQRKRIARNNGNQEGTMGEGPEQWAPAREQRKRVPRK